MKTRYSPSTGTFYPLDIDYGGNIPADIIEVPLAAHEEAMEARAAGNDIDFVGEKLVVLPPKPAPFIEQAAPLMAEIRSTREAILNRLAGMGVAAVISGNTEEADAVVAARQALLDITSAPLVMMAIKAENVDALRAAFKTEYKAIVSAVPESLRNAFKEIDA